MVLGLRSKSRKGPSVHVDYQVHVQEIKPWPPSQSLKSLRSVLLQWENGDKNTGSMKPVVPSLGTGIDDGRIEFNESFRIPVTLSRELSIKGRDADTFVKNCLEFNLYELRSNKNVKGQLLGTVIVDLAEYGILKEAAIVSAPLNCKRSFRNTAQPVLFMKIEPFQKKSSRSSSMESLPKDASLEKDGRESVSALMNGEYEEEAEIASFTDDDDDVSQHSSLTVSSSAYEPTGSSPPQSEENACEAEQDHAERDACLPDVPLDHEDKKEGGNPVTATKEHLTRSSSQSSFVESSPEVLSPENDDASLSNFTRSSSKSHSSRSGTHSVQSSSSSIDYKEEDDICINRSIDFDAKHVKQQDHEEKSNGESTLEPTAQLPLKENKTSDLEAKVLLSETYTPEEDKQCSDTSPDTKVTVVDPTKVLEQSRVVVDGLLNNNGLHTDLKEEGDGKKQMENGHKQQIEEEEEDNATEVESSSKFSRDATRNLVEGVGDATTSGKDNGVGNSNVTVLKLKHVKSVRSLVDSARNKRVEGHGQYIVEPKETSNSIDANGSDTDMVQYGRNNPISFSREAKNNFSEAKIQQLEQRVEMLERELREAAALEVALYSVVAEHGSSANKVHAPARRLSRLYFHACKGSRQRRASAARSAVSGLVLVAKASGNDVARLTFWLSNSVVLRAMIGLALGDSQLPVSAGAHNQTNVGSKRFDKVSSSLKWEEFSSRKTQNKTGTAENADDWEETHMFTTALEKIEAWIFSRIIESIWWQTLTPHMQSSTKANEEKIISSMRNSFGERPGLSNQEQAHYSMELWKKAFKDACDRLCPVRAAGHECGCLPVLAQLVMEQCVNRLDVAMFNAILRESADDIPTDPVSDPISDSKVLPIPAGKSSFGAGAQLKNAIGNWSRWLTDLFGIDYDDSNYLNEDDAQESEASSKSFHLLNALSDLMMLPKDMLLNKSIRKEVCPTFGAPLIKRVLNGFSPDEFCPDPIPEQVFQALDVEDSLDEESLGNFPCDATPVVYSPLSAAFLATFIGESGNESRLRRSGSSVLRKSYTSDDELDELDSPLASISDCFRHKTSWKIRDSGSPSVVRYELLQEVWRDGD